MNGRKQAAIIEWRSIGARGKIMKAIVGWCLAVVLLAACSPGAGGGYSDLEDGGSPTDVPAAGCEMGQSRCGDRCVDTNTNALNCGACGRACQASQSCVRGACIVLCPEGQTECDGRCVNLQSNALHCGACGRACMSGLACVAGGCSGRCDSPRSVCGDVCVDQRSDVDNCGTCGQRCADGQSCTLGACGRSCPSGTIECGAACVNLRSDPANCGRCGQACGGGTTCVDGVCRNQCPSGRTACGSSCVDLAVDPANCGACGSACPSSQSCTGGMCRVACVEPMLTCGLDCVDPGSNRTHCGRCGNPCLDGQNCVTGTCRAPTSPVRATWTFPGLMRNPVSSELRFPTYLAHTFGLITGTVGPFRFDAACVALVNGSTSAQTVNLQARMPGYASPRMQSVMLAGMESRSVCLNPIFDLGRLYGLTAITAGALEADAQDGSGTYLSRASQTVAILPVGGVVWGLTGASSPEMSALSVVQVAPFDSSVLTLRRDAEARSIFPGHFGADGYVRATFSRERTIGASRHGTHSVFLEAGEAFQVTMNDVAGGTVNMYLFTSSQYDSWFAGGAPMAIQVLNAQRAGASLRYTAVTSGNYVLVFHNVDSSAARSVRYTPSNTRFDVAYDALASVYEELRARGFSYTNISTAYYDSERVQYIRRPRELIASRTGNCIEGSVVFASVLENMGMQPVIYRIPGHAFMGVRSAPGSEVIWPVETTLLGTSPFSTAFSYGVMEVLDNASLPIESGHTIDVTAARRLGLRPIPM